jgi:hypothetical protein
MRLAEKLDWKKLILQSVLGQVHILIQSEFSTKYDLVLIVLKFRRHICLPIIIIIVDPKGLGVVAAP